MPSDGLAKAAQNNMPYVDMFMITRFRLTDAEFGNVKETSEILEFQLGIYVKKMRKTFA